MSKQQVGRVCVGVSTVEGWRVPYVTKLSFQVRGHVVQHRREADGQLGSLVDDRKCPQVRNRRDSAHILGELV